MSNNPTSPKKVVPNSPRTQSTKSHEQSSPRPASVSGTKSVSSPHSRGSTPLRSSPTSKTLTSPGNSTPQRDSTPQRGSTPRKDSTPHRDDISQRSSTPTNKKPVTQVVGDRTTSRNTPVREVPKETKKSVTPEPVNSPRPLSSGFTPIKSNKPTARPVTKLAPILVTPETGDASKSKPLPSPKRRVSGDNAQPEVSHKRSKSASDHPVIASPSFSASASVSASASKTRVTPTSEISTPSTAKDATVTTKDKEPTSEQTKSTTKTAGEKEKVTCGNCQAQFSRKEERGRHDKARRREHILCPEEGCPMEGKEFCGKTHLKKHYETLHTDVDFEYENPYKCSFEGCNKSFTSDLLLKTHHSKHQNEFPCGFCGKAFGVRHRLKKHSEKEPYYCTLNHDERIRFCNYKLYSDHHKLEHNGTKIQPKRERALKN